ncbi:MAG: GIY-YIG nuclease family protein, partial [Candidatus Levyibacteriota bacterium]
MVYQRSSYSSLPSEAGVYVFLGKAVRHTGKPEAHPGSLNVTEDRDSGQARMTREILYVGKAKDLKSRVSSYFAKSAQLGPKTKALVSQVEKINITIVESELEALLLEAFYIKKYNPKYNIRLTDNKSYVKIRITIKDDYPRVLLVRRDEYPDSVYYGPFPSSTAVKLVLKTIRRVFPFVSVRNHPKRICLYHHLGLCPCPPMFDSSELKATYRKNIRGIIRILEGQSKKIMTELEKERDTFSKEENFEKALLVQKKIKALSLITSPYHRPFEYDVNPNLRVDIRQQEMDGLMEVLNQNGFALKNLDRIECYDISNIQGTNAVGSMVVFEHGEKESSQYRKFKIRRDWEKKGVIARKHDEAIPTSMRLPRSARNDVKDSPNDFAMMREVLKRRLRHDEWNTPSLIIVDGGKGQVSSAMVALAESGMNIPLVGLAKREETIVVPRIGTRDSGLGTRSLNEPQINTYQELLEYRFGGIKEEKLQAIIVNEDNFTEVSLPKNSSSLHLVQRLRDEAHRFAITYHRKLRSKNA